MNIVPDEEGYGAFDLEQHDQRDIDRFRAELKKRLDIDDLFALISFPQIARLGGLSRFTPIQQHHRWNDGAARVPFPEPDPHLKSVGRTRFRAIDFLAYWKATGNWPLGTAARVSTRGVTQPTRGPRAHPGDIRYTLTELTEVAPDIAHTIREKKLNDGAKRTKTQWAYRARNWPAAS